MLGFVMVGTNKLEESSKFYDAILLPLGLTRVTSEKKYIGYANIKTREKIEFYVSIIVFMEGRLQLFLLVTVKRLQKVLAQK